MCLHCESTKRVISCDILDQIRRGLVNIDKNQCQQTIKSFFKTLNKTSIRWPTHIGLFDPLGRLVHDGLRLVLLHPRNEDEAAQPGGQAEGPHVEELPLGYHGALVHVGPQLEHAWNKINKHWLCYAEMFM